MAEHEIEIDPVDIEALEESGKLFLTLDESIIDADPVIKLNYTDREIV